MTFLAVLLAATALSPAAVLDEEELALAEQIGQTAFVGDELIEEGELIFGEEEIIADSEED